LGGRRLAALVTTLVVLGAALALFPASRALAHASLISSSPAANETLRRPPSRVILHFSEAIERKLTSIEVRNKDGDRVDDNTVEFDDKDPAFASIGVKDNLTPNLYFVKWTNVSAVDGHNYEGTFPFIVLNPDGSYPPGVSLSTAGAATTSGGNLLPGNVDSALKWIALLSLATTAGAAFMLFAGIRPGASFLDDQDYEYVVSAAERWVAYVAHVLLPISFIAAAFLVLRTVDRFGTSTSLVSYVTTFRIGQYRLAGLLLVMVALVGAGVLLLANGRRARAAGLAVLLLGSAGALFTYSMISHGATNPGKFWGITSDYGHLLASATWLGALAMLVPLMRRARQMPEPQRFLVLANVFDRFSIIAGISVMVILATGTFNGIAQVPNAHAMLHTTYGKVLVAKIALVLPLLAVAGLNAVLLKPRLVAAIDGAYQQGGGGTPGQRAAWQRQIAWLQRALPWTITVEVALIVAVFAAVGVLSQTSTAKSEVAQKQAAIAASSKYHQTTDAADLKLTLDITPNQVGINDFSLTIQNADGTPSTTVTQARLRFTYDQVQNLVPQSSTILGKRGDGEYRGQVSDLSQVGNWRIEADIRRSNADDVSKQFIVAVGRPASATAGAKGGAFALPFNTFNWNEVGGALLALAGATVIVYRRQLRWLQQPGYRIAMAGATLLLLSGAVLVFGVHSHTQALDPRAGNPVKPTQESVARGRLLYQQNCAQCHGDDGSGNGPAAAQLNPAPADFRLHIPYHDDPQFYNFIANGYPQSAMPKFKDAFKPDDIWNLVNFLRASFSAGATQ